MSERLVPIAAIALPTPKLGFCGKMYICILSLRLLLRIGVYWISETFSNVDSRD
jgi:hypothetical protein